MRLHVIRNRQQNSHLIVVITSIDRNRIERMGRHRCEHLSSGSEPHTTGGRSRRRGSVPLRSSPGHPVRDASNSYEEPPRLHETHVCQLSPSDLPTGRTHVRSQKHTRQTAFFFWELPPHRQWQSERLKQCPNDKAVPADRKDTQVRQKRLCITVNQCSAVSCSKTEYITTIH